MVNTAITYAALKMNIYEEHCASCLVSLSGTSFIIVFESTILDGLQSK